MRRFVQLLLVATAATAMGLGVASIQDLPTQTSTLFSGSGNCASCHGANSSSALKLSDGSDVSPTTLWRSTMMANAAKDPLWLAAVTAETADHPGLKAVIEDKCTACHTPMGHTEAIFGGANSYSIAEALADPLATDGVSCTVCHQIKDSNLGTGESFSGKYVIQNDGLVYGPYDDETWSPLMQSASGYAFQYGEHLSESALCATCHTLFTPTVDLDGNLTGGQIPEQTPYLEWKNSDYPAEGVECQTCHIPRVEEPVSISTVPSNLDGRAPFGLHYFVGGNIFMLDLMNTNAIELGVTAESVHLDSSAARTGRLLRSAADVDAEWRWLPSDSLEVSVRITNNTGHKFPTGFPSRRAWLHVVVAGPDEAVVFESGDWDPLSGEIVDLDTPYEQHRDVITSEGDVQIYQSLMQDVSGDVTWMLLRGDSYIKDNRIPPVGFTTSGPHYDTTAVSGRASSDPNFNRDGLAEGSGSDVVTYRIDGLDPNQSYDVAVSLVYQSVAPAFVTSLGRHSTPEIESFESYYSTADKSPFVVDGVDLVVTGVSVDRGPQTPTSIRITDLWPSPLSENAVLRFETAESAPVHVNLLDALGRNVRTIADTNRPPGAHEIAIEANGLASGLYFIRVSTDRHSDTKPLVIAR